MASAEIAATQPVREDLDGPYKAYNLDLKARERTWRPARRARVWQWEACAHYASILPNAAERARVRWQRVAPRARPALDMRKPGGRPP